jgi:dipeptidase E
MPIVEPPSLAALGLVRFQINPHYTDASLPRHRGETRAERLQEFCLANPTLTVIGLREGSALRVDGDAIELLGSRRARLFRGSAAARELRPGPVRVDP